MLLFSSTIYWFLTHGFLNFYLIPKHKFDYIKKPIATGTYFFINALAFTTFYLNYLKPSLQSLAIALTILVCIGIGFYLKNKNNGYGQLTFSKGWDAALQQLILFIIFNEMTRLGLNQFLNLAITFFALHIPLFFLKSVSSFAKLVLFIGISFLGALIAYNYLTFSNLSLGINLVTHMGFYILYWTLFKDYKNMGIVTFPTKQ